LYSLSIFKFKAAVIKLGAEIEENQSGEADCDSQSAAKEEKT